MSDHEETQKRHAACDECRKRKLKCSGDGSGCSRCTKQRLKCHYSMQKQMGRPRKRQTSTSTLEGDHNALSYPVNPNTANLAHDLPFHQMHHPPNLGIQRMPSQNAVHDPLYGASNDYFTQPALDFQNAHPAVYHSMSLFRGGIDALHGGMTSAPTMSPTLAVAESCPLAASWVNDLPYPRNTASQTSRPSSEAYSRHSSTRHSSYPSSDAYSAPPPPNPSQYMPNLSSSPSPLAAYHAAPSCTCLPDLYLTLSNIQSYASQPVSNQIVDTLVAASRTGHKVLYCQNCPRQVQSAFQNVMLLGTLLSVIGDTWNMIRRASGRDLARAFDTDLGTTLLTDAELHNSWTPAKEAQWRLFSHYLVRQYVFGDAPPPGIHFSALAPLIPNLNLNPSITSPTTSTGPSSSPTSSPPTSTPHLHKPQPIILFKTLCSALERRQKTWHGSLEYTGEFPKPGGKMLYEAVGVEHGSGERNHLCFDIVSRIKGLLGQIDRDLQGQGTGNVGGVGGQGQRGGHGGHGGHGHSISQSHSQQHGHGHGHGHGHHRGMSGGRGRG